MTEIATVRQREVLEAARVASDGYIQRNNTRVWRNAPTAVYACARRGWLDIDMKTYPARLTDAGRAVLEGSDL